MAEQARSEGISVDFQPMSPEERERLMQFLLNQHAQFEAAFARIDANIDRRSTKTDRIAEGLIGLAAVVGSLAAAQLRTDQQRHEAAERFREDLREMDSQFRQSLIDTFERHLRDDHQRPPS